MPRLTRRLFVSSLLATGTVPALQPALAEASDEAIKFVCPPCGCAMDDVVFDAPGTCPDCGMILQPQDDPDLGFEPTILRPGGGQFQVSGGRPHRDATIRVHYFLPPGFTADSPILLVIPGAGRNSNEYRNAWLETALENSVLVAALGYPEDRYDFARYHMGGVIRDLDFRTMPVGPDGRRPAVITLRDEDIRFTPNPDRESWLFPDFDRIFARLKAASGSTRDGYDIFGHSAGGQILHRLALFHAGTKARRIMAANAGFYTLPDPDRPLPTGLKGSGISARDLDASLAARLTVLLGRMTILMRPAAPCCTPRSWINRASTGSRAGAPSSAWDRIWRASAARPSTGHWKRYRASAMTSRA